MDFGRLKIGNSKWYLYAAVLVFCLSCLIVAINHRSTVNQRKKIPIYHAAQPGDLYAIGQEMVFFSKRMMMRTSDGIHWDRYDVTDRTFNCDNGFSANETVYFSNTMGTIFIYHQGDIRAISNQKLHGTELVGIVNGEIWANILMNTYGMLPYTAWGFSESEHTWKIRPVLNSRVRKLINANGRIVVITDGQAFIVTNDSERIYCDIPDASLNDVVWANDHILAITDERIFSMIISNGGIVATDTIDVPATKLRRIFSVNNHYFVTGYYNESGGLTELTALPAGNLRNTYILSTPGKNMIYSMLYFKGEYFADAGRVLLRSRDGMNWQSVTLPRNYDLMRMAVFNDKIIAEGWLNDDYSEFAMLYSENGTDWRNAIVENRGEICIEPYADLIIPPIAE